MQPETAKLVAFYQCDPLFGGCSNLKLANNNLDPITLIASNRIVFNRQYNFNATITNPNAKLLKSLTDPFSFYVTAPELTEDPLPCLNFSLIFKNKTLAFSAQNSNLREVLFNNNNYTDIVITGPSVNISQCVNLYGPNIMTLTFTTFDNPTLFDDIHSYSFNSTPITITSQKIQSALSYTQNQTLNSYAYLYRTDTKAIIGYQYVKLKLNAGDQTLYAKIAQTFIQVDKDRILYIDGGSSFDLKFNNSLFTYVWGVEGFPNLILPTSRLLALSPDQRTALGINQPGRYYNYTLVVQVDQRSSYPTKILVQVAPGLDPNYCVTVTLKDIDIMQIVTYTTLPLLLQARVIRNNCTDMVMGSLVWSCSDVSWKFWTNIGNNNTVGMDPADLKKLPKSKNIRMNVTQYYRVASVEYMAILNFQLFVQSPDLVPVLSYPQVYNPRDSSYLIMESNSSYDPQAVAQNTTSIPIKCSWECPNQFLDICTSAKSSTANNGCTLTIPSVSVLASSNYNFQLAGQMWLFKNSITKDSRQTISYVYVSIIDNYKYPMCNLTIQKAFQNSINSYQYLNATCKPTLISNPTKFTYLWSLYQWDTGAYIPELQYITTDQAVMRIPPYLLSQYKEVLVQLMVTADVVYSTPIGMYLKFNDQSNFIKGSISVNFNTFTAYLSSFIMTPSGWDSALSSLLTFQYRIKESNSAYRVLVSPLEASSLLPINTILPPFSYENAVYIDVIDTLGNFFTIRQPIVSKLDTIMTATQFAVRVNNITQTIVYSFNEIILEQQLYKLKMYYQAYESEQLNLEGQPPAYFKILSEQTVAYLYNTFVIDKRLTQVQSFERRYLINQHIIETLYSMTQQVGNVMQQSSVNQTMILLNQVMLSGNYTLGSQINDISQKIFMITYSLQDGNQNLTIGGQNAFDLVQLRQLRYLQNFLYQGESTFFSQDGFNFTVRKLSGSVSNLLDLPTFQYDKNEVFGIVGAPVGGMMILAQNSSYAHVQMYDRNLIPLGVNKLSKAVSLTFTMPADVMQRYLVGLINLQCASRDTFTSTWSSTRITTGNVNNVTGAVTCLALHFTQYTLFMTDKAPPAPAPPAPLTPEVDPTKIKVVNETEISGTWNATLPNSPYTIGGPTVILFEEKSMLMYLLSLSCLVFFILTHCFFKRFYKAEHNDQPKRDLSHSFTYQYKDGRCKNRLRLFRLIWLNFNPYANLFLVYNKFLPRWVRNLMIQIFFMAVSVGIGINQTLISFDLTTFTTDQLNIAIFFIVIGCVLIVRPIAIKLIYKLLYEPYSRVEDYIDTSSPETLTRNQMEGQYIGQVVDYDELKATAGEQNQQHFHAVSGFLNQNMSMMSRRELEVDKELMNSGVLMREESIKSNTSGQKESFRQQSIRASMEKQEQFSAAPQSFLPSIFGPSRGMPGAAFVISPSPDTMPSLGNQKNTKSMFNAFDEIDLEKDHIPQLDDSDLHKQEKQKNDGLPDIFGNKNQLPQREKATLKKSKKKKQQSRKKDENLLSNQKTDQGEDQTKVVDQQQRQSNSYLPDIKGASRANYDPTLKQSKDLNRSSVQRQSNQGNPGFMQFYQDQSVNPDIEDDNDLNPQFEGGSDEEEKQPQSKAGQGTQRHAPEEGQLERMDSIEENPKTILRSIDSPNTDIYSMQNGGNYPSSSEGRFIEPNPQKQKGTYNDPLVEHTMNLTNNSSDAIFPNGGNPYQSIYVSKHFGKAIVFIVWAGLIVGNLMCFSRMVAQQFTNWVIMSCAAYFSIVFVIDTLLYLILACVMMKAPHADETQGLTKLDGAASRIEVEYFTRREDKRSKCAELFVCLFVGKEKMKDLRRRLNPMSPI